MGQRNIFYINYTSEVVVLSLFLTWATVFGPCSTKSTFGNEGVAVPKEVLNRHQEHPVHHQHHYFQFPSQVQPIDGQPHGLDQYYEYQEQYSDYKLRKRRFRRSGSNENEKTKAKKSNGSKVASESDSPDSEKKGKSRGRTNMKVSSKKSLPVVPESRAESLEDTTSMEKEEKANIDNKQKKVQGANGKTKAKNGNKKTAGESKSKHKRKSKSKKDETTERAESVEDDIDQVDDDGGSLMVHKDKLKVLDESVDKPSKTSGESKSDDTSEDSSAENSASIQGDKSDDVDKESEHQGPNSEESGGEDSEDAAAQDSDTSDTGIEGRNLEPAKDQSVELDEESEHQGQNSDESLGEDSSAKTDSDIEGRSIVPVGEEESSAGSSSDNDKQFKKSDRPMVKGKQAASKAHGDDAIGDLASPQKDLSKVMESAFDKYWKNSEAELKKESYNSPLIIPGTIWNDGKTPRIPEAVVGDDKTKKGTKTPDAKGESAAASAAGEIKDPLSDADRGMMLLKQLQTGASFFDSL